MSRRKKILKWTAVVLLGLVAIGLVANACFVWITDTRLERQLAAIRAAGDPSRWPTWPASPSRRKRTPRPIYARRSRAWRR